MDLQDMLGIEALWIVPESNDIPPYLLIEPWGGPKAYIRVYTTLMDSDLLDARPRTEWTWIKPDNAIQVTSNGRAA